MLNALTQTADLLSMHTSSKQTLGSPDFTDKQYVSKPFSALNFKEIVLPKENSSCKLAFVDAGNFELLGSSNFSVHLIRGYFSMFGQNKRVVPKNIPQKIEMFSIAIAKESPQGIAYECSLIPVSQDFGRFFPSKKLVFDSFDETLSARKNFRANISVIGAAIRRYLEWSIASVVIEQELDSGDILLRDGALEASVTGEGDYSKKAFDSANAKKVSLCALAKTSALLTTTGIPLVYAVDSIADSLKMNAPWIYYPLCENANPLHPAEIFVAKLHKDSARAFRFDMDKSAADNEERVMSALSEISGNSCDASFIGYPYGLIDADSMSRISVKEAGNYRAMLSSVLEKKGALASIQKLSGAIDAHDVLNEIIL
ncbi:hypothetical protein L6303_07670 [archaeon]|nr:hypothetical protein [Nanoarchaeota archaeon]MBU4451921.1 hypothetical protein [Nanoarchaeota archaeon]MCG2724594.1 hypothetical protein [archaeon]